MTVQTSDIVSGPFSGNDVTDTFDYEFKITDTSQIAVFETDDEGEVTQLTLLDDFTVTGVGDDEGGTVTRVAGPLPTGYTWVMIANYPYNQLTAFASQGGFFPQVHENVVDKLTYLILQLLRRTDLSLSFPDYYTGSTIRIVGTPGVGKILRMDANGNLVWVDQTDISLGDSDLTVEPGHVITGDKVRGRPQTLEIVDGVVTIDWSSGMTFSLYMDQDCELYIENVDASVADSIALEVENAGEYDFTVFSLLDDGYTLMIPEDLEATQPAHNGFTSYGMQIFNTQRVHLFRVVMIEN